MARSHGGHTVRRPPGEPAQAGALRVDLLGPMRLLVDAEPVAIPGVLRRAALARLVLARGDRISLDTLIDDLWPDGPPRAGRRAVHTHVWRLRNHLGRYACRLEQSGAGYRLDLCEQECDLLVLDACWPTVRRRLAGDPGAELPAALALVGLWRGDALAEFTDLPAFAPEAAALAEQRKELTDEVLAAVLATGDHHGAIDAGMRAVALDPLRERTHRLLMTAMASSGRAADALRVGHEYRRRLVDATGLDPTSELTDLERRILAAMPPAGSVDPPTAPSVTAPAATVTPMVGRERDLEDLTACCARPGLVTLTGVGGVGKTRLAVELVGRTTDRPTGVVALAGVQTAAAVPDASAAALGLQPVGLRPAGAMIADLVGDDPWLVLLDNCEHVLQAARDLVASLLEACRRLTVVTTSREPLGLPAEVTVRIGPLDVPPDDGDVSAVEASAGGRLFLDRARHGRRPVPLDPAGSAAVAGIVRALDGLPLAIELAAGRLHAFTVEDLHARIERAPMLLRGGRAAGSARHTSLKATLEWSYRLLTADEQALLGALALFPGGVTLDTAEAIGVAVGVSSDPADALSRLVDTSLVEPVLDAHPARYRMLEVVRAFALGTLDENGLRGRAEAGQEAWARGVAGAVASSFGTAREPDAVATSRRELPNLRAVHDRARARGDVGLRRALVVDLHDLCSLCDVPEVVEWGRQLVDELPDQADGVAFGVAARSALMQGDTALAERWGRRGLALARPGTPTTAASDALSTALLYQGRLEESYEVSVAGAEATGETDAWRAAFLAMAGLAAGYLGASADAWDRTDAAIELADRTGSHVARILARYVRAELSAVSDPSAALVDYEIAAQLGREVSSSFFEGISRVGMASLHLAAGKVDDALAQYRSLIAVWQRLGMWTQQWTTLRNVSRALLAAGDPGAALALVVAAGRAADTPALSAEAEADLDTLAADCRQRLDPAECERVVALASAADGPAIVTLALSAIDAALTGPTSGVSS